MLEDLEEMIRTSLSLFVLWYGFPLWGIPFFVVSVVQSAFQLATRKFATCVAVVLVFVPAMFPALLVFNFLHLDGFPFSSRISFWWHVTSGAVVVSTVYWCGTAFALANWTLTACVARRYGRRTSKRADTLLKIACAVLLPITIASAYYFTTYQTLEDAVREGNLALAEKRLRFNLFGVDANNGLIEPMSAKLIGTLPLLPLAIERGDIEMVHLLLEHGADPDARFYGYGAGTPAAYAAARGRIEILKVFLDRGIDPNTALHDAAQENRVDSLKLLLERGADPATRNGLGRTALEEAKAYKAEDAVRFLTSVVDGGASEKALSDQSASRAGSP